MYRLVLFLAFLSMAVFTFFRYRRAPGEFKKLFLAGLAMFVIGAIVRAIDIAVLFISVPHYTTIHIVGHVVFTVGIVLTFVKFLLRMEGFFYPVGPEREFSKAAYLGKTPQDALRLFNDSTKILAITRSPDLYEGLDGVKIVWVTGAGEKGIPPTALHVLGDLAIRFATENENAAVIVDCVEYLILYNGFNAVFKFLVNLKDNLLLRGAKLVIVVNPETLGKRELALLRKEFEDINGGLPA
ncbi:DUF835 domain-containing protein [Pyrococcus yayanosii]|uniref:DUF835 domain-containing protein n=1 Tax=Pyrococcus yayanosii (strain CH1 / JCM 16557) TaxID=529709 RepID=F8AGU3_PYRYC|nr:DUF835 domain-containing protein [Pyrococcus yayanosii]AEH25229.1 hypothetical protein PYCH_15630 [Pyrococcus yayanosii CH1]